MFPACPTSWATPSTMDFAYDGLYNSFTPSGYNSSFSSVLSQTLGELDIDNSIHKLFEGLPEIFEDYSSKGLDVDALRDAVVPAVTMASPVFPSTPPAHIGSRPSSIPAPGSLVVPQGFVDPIHGSLAARPGTIPVASIARDVDATPLQQPVQIRPTGGPELQLPVTVATGRKAGRAWESAYAAARGRGESKAPAAQSKVLEAIHVPTSQAPSIVSAVAYMVPRILPATAMPAVNLTHVKVNEHVASPHLPGLGPQVCVRAPKRRKPEPVQLANTRTQKTRYFDKVEHIVRERWRRDDMAAKFLALESLLPPSTKRDRSTIVEDSMKLVKSLQRRKEEALKRRAELKEALVTASQSPGPKLSRIIQKISSLSVMLPLQQGSVQRQVGGDSAAAAAAMPGPPLCSARPLDDSSVQKVPKSLSDCVLRFYVHSEVTTGDIVIEMICEQIPGFHSALLKSLESLGLEVIRCSITRTVNKLICNVTVKPLPSAASVNSPQSSIMEGLSSAFQKEA